LNFFLKPPEFSGRVRASAPENHRRVYAPAYFLVPLPSLDPGLFPGETRHQGRRLSMRMATTRQLRRRTPEPQPAPMVEKDRPEKIPARPTGRRPQRSRLDTLLAGQFLSLQDASDRHDDP